MSLFKKATKQQARARVALVGPSGSGKTYTALTLAAGLGGRVAVVDTERGSASKYADRFSFDCIELDTFDLDKGREVIDAASGEGYDVLVVDSLSHFWMGDGGALSSVDSAAARSQSKNTFNAWREVTPKHNKLIDAILRSRCHVIATMRAKTEYVLEDNGRGKQVPRKVGLAPVMRDGVEYEFDVCADIDLDNNFIVSKTRCPELRQSHGGVWPRAEGVAGVLRNWLTDGAPRAETAHDTLRAETDALVSLLQSASTQEEVAAAAAKAKAAGLVNGDRERVMAAYREASARLKRGEAAE